MSKFSDLVEEVRAANGTTPYNPIGVGEALSRKDFGENVPFYGGVVTYDKAKQLSDQSNRYKAWLDAPDDPKHPYNSPLAVGWKKIDEEALREHFTQQQELQSRGTTVWADIATGAIDSATFMAEFMATAGVGKAVAAPIQAAGKIAVARLVSAGVGRLGLGAVEGLTSLGTGVAKAATVTALAHTPKIMAETVQRLTPEISLTPEGSLFLAEASETPASALFKSIGNVFIEDATEFAGGSLAKGAGKLAKWTKVAPILKKAEDAIGKMWVGMATGRTARMFMDKVAEKAGWHGIVSEMGEERLADVTRAITGIDSPEANPSDNIFERFWQKIPSGRQLLTELGIFAIPGAIRASAAPVDLMLDRRAETKNRNAAASLSLMEQLGWTPQQASSVAERASGRKGDYVANLEREITDEHIVSPEGLSIWAGEYPAQAEALSLIEKPSRKDFDQAGLPRRSGADRQQIAASLREVMAAGIETPVEEEAVTASQSDVATETVAGPATAVEAVQGQQEAAPAVRELDSQGRPMDGKAINPGDTFKTLSGRDTTPYPKTTKKMHKGDVRVMNQWLIDNATEEARSRGDEFNAGVFSGEKADNLPQGSSDSMAEYLFSEQPAVQAPITTPLVETAENTPGSPLAPGSDANQGREVVTPPAGQAAVVADEPARVEARHQENKATLAKAVEDGIIEQDVADTAVELAHDANKKGHDVEVRVENRERVLDPSEGSSDLKALRKGGVSDEQIQETRDYVAKGGQSLVYGRNHIESGPGGQKRHVVTLYRGADSGAARHEFTHVAQRLTGRATGSHVEAEAVAAKNKSNREVMDSIPGAASTSNTPSAPAKIDVTTMSEAEIEAHLAKIAADEMAKAEQSDGPAEPRKTGRQTVPKKSTPKVSKKKGRQEATGTTKDNTPAPAPTMADKADAAKAELAGALGDLGKYLDGMNFSNPLADPQLWALTGKVVAKAIKAGVYSFAKMVHQTTAAIGDRRARKLGPVLAKAWDRLRELDSSGRMDVAGDVDSILGTSGEDHGDNAGDRGQDQGGSGEGTQVRIGSGGEGTSQDAGGVGGNAATDGGGTEAAGGEQNAGQAAGREGDGAVGGTTEAEADAADGRGGASGEGLVSDGGRGGRAGGGRSGVGSASDRDGREAATTNVQSNYRIRDPEALVGGGPKNKFSRNQRAIEVYQQVSSEGRPATEDERDAIASYIGWGSIWPEDGYGTWDHPSPKDGWEKEAAWLREHLGEQEWKSAQASIINAHYTDPPTVTAIWSIIRKMGFKGGRVLEPSMGVGNFFGLMPADLAEKSQLTGIEMDELTGGMAKMLYPQANISIKGYQDSQTPDGFYDLSVGNFPFAADGPATRRYSKLAPSLHDFFFLKTIDQTRPGGLVVAITSAGTLDKLGQTVRLELSKKADLVGAFRLPTGAFGKYAGTAVVTDLLVFKVRSAEAGLQGVPHWVQTEDADTPSGQMVRVNSYYVDNPNNVLGTLNYGSHTTNGRPGMVVDRPKDYEKRLATLADRVAEGVYEERGTAVARRYVTNNSQDRVNSVIIGDGGDLYVSFGEQMSPLEDVTKIAIKSLKKTQARRREIGHLVQIRKAYGLLIDQQRDGDDSTETTRAGLRGLYREFVKNYGPINDSFALSVLKRVGDPSYFPMAALERNVSRPGEAPKYVETTIMDRSTVRSKPRPEDMGVQDAYMFQRNENLVLDADRIAELAKVTVDQAVSQMEKDGTIFKTPVGNYEHADVYLSGNVRLKLREAEQAKGEGIAGMDRNIAELKKVVPADIPYYSIEAKLGNTWVTPDVYTRFIGDMLGVDAEKAANGVQLTFSPQGWKVRLPASLANRAEASSNFGTPSVSFAHLVESAMRNRPVTVRFKDFDGTEHVDEELTALANEKIANMQEHFSSWVWSEPDRRIRLERIYNDTMNSVAPPKFDGNFLAFEGMMLERGEQPFNLRQHQVSAIARGVISGRGIYAHEVGTGKSFVLGGIAVESRRYGRARKPLLFAHNANSASVAAEIQEMYPGAKVLYVDNLSKENKAITLARIVNDDWDLIVVPHSMADRFALRPESYAAMAAEEIAELEAAAIDAAAEDGHGLSVEDMDDARVMGRLRSPTAKDLVRSRNRIKERILAMSQKSSEDSIILEDAGIDMMMVDEVHEFKKPPIATTMRMKGLNTATSNRSINMMFMLRYIGEINGGRGVHLSTGTPITNTLNEIYNLMRYVMPKEMKTEGIAHWDAWFNAFAKEETEVEVTSAGDYEPVSRLSDFVNSTELRRIVGQYMDTVFADQMPEFKDRPTKSGKVLSDPSLTDSERRELTDGRQENPEGRPYKLVKTEVAEMTNAQKRIRSDLLQRARLFRSATKKQRYEMMHNGSNAVPIRVDSDATKAGLDARLMVSIPAGSENDNAEFFNALPDDPASKVNRAIGNVMRHYREHPLATQVIFMEQGTSDYVKREKTVGTGEERHKVSEKFRVFNLANDIVKKLVASGIPAEQIAVVTGKTSKQKRAEIAAAMNRGEIRVTIGSTQTLGTGVNMQENLRAVHHLDAPWRPGDLTQRNGRIWRQGNKWNAGLEYRYVTEGIDGKRWQVLVRKDRMIRRFLDGTGGRIISGDEAAIDDDEGGNDLTSTLSDATGDPRILLVEKAKKDIERLQRRERLYSEGIYDTENRVTQTRRDITTAEQAATNRQDLADTLAKTENLSFRLTIGNEEFTDRKKAESKLTLDKASWTDTPAKIGEYRELILIASRRSNWTNGEAIYTLNLVHPDHLGTPDLIQSQGTLQGLDTSIRNNAKAIEQAQVRVEDLKQTVARLTDAMGQPFPQQPQLETAVQRLAQLKDDLSTNPVPPPAWLRQPTPIGTTVRYEGQSRTVAGHLWNETGWFVRLEPIADGEQTIAPYLAVTDEQGADLYQKHEFSPPSADTSPAVDTQSDDDSTDEGETDRMDYPGGATMSASTGGAVKNNRTQAADVVRAIRRLWPKLSIRGKATFKYKNPGWYVAALGEMRVKDARDIAVLTHELGHHFDRQLDHWSKTKGQPRGVAADLVDLGKELYGDKKPRGGLRAEGFAEFIRRYLMGDNMAQKSPALHTWFTTQYLVEHPDEAKRLRELTDLVGLLQVRTPEQVVRAFMQPLRKDWSIGRIAATAAAAWDKEIIDENFPLLRSMQATEADLDAIDYKDHPFMLLTAYKGSAGGIAAHFAFTATTNIHGNRETGIGLRQAIAPVSEKGEAEEDRFWLYAVAREALHRNSQGKQSGISDADAQAVVDQHQSETFDQVLQDVTDWNHRVLYLRVEAGLMTQSQYDLVVRENPIYVPMFRQFGPEELKKGKDGSGLRMFTFKGSGREIHHPQDAMIAQAEKIIVSAMQGDILRATVKFYDANKGKAESLGLMLSEVPAPIEATTFQAEQIKKQMAAKAVELGADAQEVASAMLETWEDDITVFSKAKEYRGKDNVISVVVDGDRRFFEVQSDLMPILAGMEKEAGFIGGKIGKILRGVVGMQRLGATGLNPAFGLLRNTLRDAQGTAIQSDYHFHIPILSTLHGVVLDLMNNKYAKMYHGAGVDLSGWVGQDLNTPIIGRSPARYMSRRVSANGVFQRAWRDGIVNGVRELLSRTEIGPRLMEFRGAYKEAINNGYSEDSAAVLAACAAKDVTTNFTRSGRISKKINQVVLFYGASLQSIDKFARTFGAREAMPWAKHKSRGVNFLRTMARGAMYLTVVALLNYLRNRDEKWWKELTVHEKWGFIHIQIGDEVLRIPLSFEHGATFGALPVALLEEARTPGTFKEALKQVVTANTPVDLTSLHAMVSNFAILSPLADILANKDWTGRPIVPVTILENREPADQYGPDTNWLSKQIGKSIGKSPAQIEHLLSQYTGGLYKRLAGAIDKATDPSSIKTSEPSSLPVLGTLFLRPGTSRVTNDFYTRIAMLRQKAGSQNASLAEIGELTAAEKLSRGLTELWSKRRDAIAADKTSTETNKMMADIQAKVREHQAVAEDVRRAEGIGHVAYAATDPKAETKEVETAQRLLADVPDDEIRQALQEEAGRRGLKTVRWTKKRKSTAYGRRVQHLNGLGVGK